MKNSTLLQLKKMLYGAMVCLVAFTSCDSDTPGGEGPNSGFEVNRDDLRGQITEGDRKSVV